jgi:hypothetical protein
MEEKLMVPGAVSWSKERIGQEIQNRRAELQENIEAVEYHREQYDRFPGQGYQGDIAENNVSALREEIDYLTLLL